MYDVKISVVPVNTDKSIVLVLLSDLQQDPAI
jgi:hypothetical protein